MLKLVIPCRTVELTIANISLLVCIGLVAGVLGSMLGVGGGFIIVPLLTLALKLPMQVAIGSSLVAIVANSSISASAYIKTRMTNIKLGLLLETTTVPGAIVGAVIVSLMTSSVIGVIFGIVSLYVSYSMMFSPPPVITEDINQANNLADSSDVPERFVGQSEHIYYDLYQNRASYYRINRISLGLTAGFFAGILSTMLGIGGGIIKVPVMHSLMGIPIKVAIGTSCFMIAITSATGALIYYYYGYVNPSIVTPLILGVVGGSSLGVSLAQKVKGAWLRRCFAGLLLVIAILMLLRATNVIGI